MKPNLPHLKVRLGGGAPNGELLHWSNVYFIMPWRAVGWPTDEVPAARAIFKKQTIL